MWVFWTQLKKEKSIHKAFSATAAVNHARAGSLVCTLPRDGNELWLSPHMYYKNASGSHFIVFHVPGGIQSNVQVR